MSDEEASATESPPTPPSLGSESWWRSKLGIGLMALISGAGATYGVNEATETPPSELALDELCSDARDAAMVLDAVAADATRILEVVERGFEDAERDRERLDDTIEAQFEDLDFDIKRSHARTYRYLIDGFDLDDDVD